jgi:hypothetical protein
MPRDSICLTPSQLFPEEIMLASMHSNHERNLVRLQTPCWIDSNVSPNITVDLKIFVQILAVCSAVVFLRSQAEVHLVVQLS